MLQLESELQHLTEEQTSFCPDTSSSFSNNSNTQTQSFRTTLVKFVIFISSLFKCPPKVRGFNKAFLNKGKQLLLLKQVKCDTGSKNAEKEVKVSAAVKLAAAAGPLCQFSLTPAHPSSPQLAPARPRSAKLTQAHPSSPQLGQAHPTRLNRIIDPPPVLLPTSCLSLCAVSKVTWRRSTCRVPVKYSHRAAK